MQIYYDRVVINTLSQRDLKTQGDHARYNSVCSGLCLQANTSLLASCTTSSVAQVSRNELTTWRSWKEYQPSVHQPSSRLPSDGYAPTYQLGSCRRCRTAIWRSLPRRSHLSVHPCRNSMTTIWAWKKQQAQFDYVAFNVVEHFQKLKSSFPVPTNICNFQKRSTPHPKYWWAVYLNWLLPHAEAVGLGQVTSWLMK